MQIQVVLGLPGGLGAGIRAFLRACRAGASSGSLWTCPVHLKGPGGVNASLMSFGGTGSHKCVVVRLIEIVSGGINLLIFT